MGSAPVGVQCPVTSSPGEFLGYWAGSGEYSFYYYIKVSRQTATNNKINKIWYPGLPPVLVSIAFPFAVHISVFFHSLFSTCHWISFLFLLYGRRICTH